MIYQLGGKRVMLFLFNKFPRELQRCPDVFDGQVIFPLHFLKGHSTGQISCCRELRLAIGCHHTHF